MLVLIRCIVHQNIQVVHASLEILEARKQTKRIATWLAPSDPSINYNEALQKRHEGTGLWFIDSKVFRNWKKQSNLFLWLHGIPGCGKTVLSAAIIETLKQNLTASQVLLFFFFDFSDSNKQSLGSMLRCFLGQLYQQQPSIRGQIDASWASCSQGMQQPSVMTLQAIFGKALSKFRSTKIVLDALDESNTRTELLSWLEHCTRSNKFQVIVTARREEDIETAIKGWYHAEKLAIEQREVDRDIKMFVNHVIHSDPRMDRWSMRPDVQEEIESKLMEKAGGT